MRWSGKWCMVLDYYDIVCQKLWILIKLNRQQFFDTQCIFKYFPDLEFTHATEKPSTIKHANPDIKQCWIRMRKRLLTSCKDCDSPFWLVNSDCARSTDSCRLCFSDVTPFNWLSTSYRQLSLTYHLYISVCWSACLSIMPKWKSRHPHTHVIYSVSGLHRDGQWP